VWRHPGESARLAVFLQAIRRRYGPGIRQRKFIVST
jgi:hypothetical protein